MYDTLKYGILILGNKHDEGVVIMEDNKVTVSEEIIDYITSKQKGVPTTLDTPEEESILGIDESGDGKKYMIDDGFNINGPDGKTIDPFYSIDGIDGKKVDPSFYIDPRSL